MVRGRVLLRKREIGGQRGEGLISAWSLLGLIKDSDIKAALGAEVTGGEDDLASEWDAIDERK